MRTPAILLVLFLIGHTHSITIKAQSEEKPKPHLGLTVDPGFVVTTATLGDAPLKKCTEVTSTDKACYEQDVKTKVNFLLQEVRAGDTVDFEGGTKTLTVVAANAKDNQIVEKTNKIAEENYPLDFSPTKITAKRTMDGATSDVASVDKSGSCVIADDTNCLAVVSEEAPVKVYVDFEKASEPQVVTLNGEAGKKFQATLYVVSAAESISRSVAVILANLAIFNLIQ